MNQRSLFSTMFFRHQRPDNELPDRDDVPEVDTGDGYKWNEPLHSAVEAGLKHTNRGHSRTTTEASIGQTEMAKVGPTAETNWPEIGLEDITHLTCFHASMAIVRPQLRPVSVKQKWPKSDPQLRRTGLRLGWKTSPALPAAIYGHSQTTTETRIGQTEMAKVGPTAETNWPETGLEDITRV